MVRTGQQPYHPTGASSRSDDTRTIRFPASCKRPFFHYSTNRDREVCFLRLIAAETGQTQPGVYVASCSHGLFDSNVFNSFAVNYKEPPSEEKRQIKYQKAGFEKQDCSWGVFPLLTLNPVVM
jgi:hypothetical protein